MLARPSESWLAEGNRAAFGEGAAQQKVAPPDNVAATLQLGQRLAFNYRGKTYVAEPTPFLEGLRLSELWQKYDELEPGKPEEYEEWKAALTEMVALFKRLCRPANLGARLLYHLRPNPFRHASPREVGQLVGFFSLCRGLSGVSLSLPEQRKESQ